MLEESTLWKPAEPRCQEENLPAKQPAQLPRPLGLSCVPMPEPVEPPREPQTAGAPPCGTAGRWQHSQEGTQGGRGSRPVPEESGQPAALVSWWGRGGVPLALTEFSCSEAARSRVPALPAPPQYLASCLFIYFLTI